MFVLAVGAFADEVNFFHAFFSQRFDIVVRSGCAVYGVDTTVDLRPDAETLPDRGKVYSTSQKKAIPGHQYSWLGRIVSQAPAWFAPRDVERVAPWDTPAVVAARQVLCLAATLVVAGLLNVVVADSGYAVRLSSGRSQRYTRVVTILDILYLEFQ